VAGGEIASGRIDIYPQKMGERKLRIEGRLTNEILGLKLELSEIQRLLRSIGLAVEPAPDAPEEALQVIVPFSRHDLEREIDLVEEVARLNGYDRIPVTMPVSRMICHLSGGRQRGVARIRDAVVARGFSEVINYSFVSPTAWDRIALEAGDARRRTVKILNPLNEEQSVMRTSLVPSLLETVSRNLAYRTRDLQLFELRPVFLPRAGEELPDERRRLVMALCGRRAPEGWTQGGAMVDFYDLKGVVEDLIDHFRVDKVLWPADAREPYLHPGKSCRIESAGALLGTLGEVHPVVLQNYDIDTPVYLLDLDIEAFLSVSRESEGFRPLSRFPDVYRDSALLVDESVTAQMLFDAVAAVRGKLVEDFVLFDLYRGKGVPEGKKSLAIRVRYRSLEKTLTEEEIGKAHGKIIRALEEKLGAEVR
jgi:phenylalanyl-tRNA synthetase beta chain